MTDTGPPPVGARIDALDGLRGIAILLVIAYHCFPDAVPGGFVGVDLFFVLSGFLITSLLKREYEQTGLISLRAFWIRRALRLLPAATVALLVVLFIGALTSGPHVNYQIRLFVLASATDLANIAEWFGYPLYAAYTWSLSAEEQFYLLWPLILIGVLSAIRFGRRSLRSVIVALLISVAAIGLLRAAGWAAGLGALRLYYNPVLHADGLLAGCALALAFDRLPRAGGSVCLMAGIATLLAVSLTTSSSGSFMYLGGYTLVVAGATLAVYSAATVTPTTVSRWLSNRPLLYVGRISYGLYIWNSLVISILPGSAAGRALGVTVTFLIATSSYLLLERRALQLKARYTTSRSLTAAVA
jgi:peptidoglycan/LPS O-acetylase OafA/YrhL